MLSQIEFCWVISCFFLSFLLLIFFISIQFRFASTILLLFDTIMAIQLLLFGLMITNVIYSNAILMVQHKMKFINKWKQIKDDGKRSSSVDMLLL